MKEKNDNWKPLTENILLEIRSTFNKLFSDDDHNGMASKISEYWVKKLEEVWKNKPEAIKRKDRQFIPADLLSRIQQKTVVITYADSVKKPGEESLVTLDHFLSKYFPAVRGMHMLPACMVAEDRFNDGFFSQVVRDRIHPTFGTNQKFSEMMGEYYSMADFVLNHVDINNPMFQAYLDGDDEKGKCFYVYSEKEYRAHLNRGDFDQIFRPRPFPLFTIFSKKPENKAYHISHNEKVEVMNRRFKKGELPKPIVSLLSIFNKIKNDQMLLDEDYRHITAFRNYLKKQTSVNSDEIFTTSETQETRDVPFIFQDIIKDPIDLLKAIGYDAESARDYAETYLACDPEIFGKEIRALTTFSHVQVDLNTTTYQGLKMLSDDFSWYLSLDLDMLRLDAANFAFKKWKTTCFGLPEVTDLMKILYLSIDSVSPRIVANLEVNDQLGSILAQMADKKAPPPMMYDFHLASMLPVVFNTGNSNILSRIFKKIAEYDVPKESIRFSLTESHDGKSVRGSLDLLTLAERQILADMVEKNGGRIKYKSVQERQYDLAEFHEVCKGAKLDFESSIKRLFNPYDVSDSVIILKDEVLNEADMASALSISLESLSNNDTLRFFINKVLNGKEPYELCISTLDSLIELQDKAPEAERYLAFYTLAFALMGRNVKSIYFNDLTGLGNDYDRLKESGELRDLKRTKSDINELEKLISDPGSVHYSIAKGINNLIALVDSDPALNFRGNEARAELSSGGDPSLSVAVVYNSYGDYQTLVIVNIGQKTEQITIDSNAFDKVGWPTLFDNICGREVKSGADGNISMTVQPFQRMWLTDEKIDIPSDMLL